MLAVITKKCRRNRLCKKIWNLINIMSMENIKLFVLNLIMGKIEVDGHMLHAATKNRIHRNISGADIFTENS